MQNKSGRSIGAAMSEDRAFREFFGTSAIVAVVIWRLLVENEMLPEGGTIMHLLWTLFFFKVYPKQGPACSAAGGSNGAIDPKTWRKYIWPFVYAIADLEPIVIIFENRKQSGSTNDCLLSVDCTDLRIPQHGRKFASHKFKGKSALRYELALDIISGDLVWVNGPFPAGAWPDIEIFRDCLSQWLDLGERIEADDGYIGDAPDKVKCPKSITNPEENEVMQKRVRSRQETINKRVKQWEILKQEYRQDRKSVV